VVECAAVVIQRLRVADRHAARRLLRVESVADDRQSRALSLHRPVRRQRTSV